MLQRRPFADVSAMEPIGGRGIFLTGETFINFRRPTILPEKGTGVSRTNGPFRRQVA
jgi:hypothetical protein